MVRPAVSPAAVSRASRRVRGRGQRGHHRVGEDVHPAAAGPVQFKDGQQAEQDGPATPPVIAGLVKYMGEHGGGCGGLVKHQPQHRGEDRQQKDQPGSSGSEQPPQF